MILSSNQRSNNMLEQWILPVFNRANHHTTCGQCFIVGSYLITAAHVIYKDDEYVDAYVVIENNPIYLHREQALLYELSHTIDENYHDYAVFALPEVSNSPLHLKSITDNRDCLTCFYQRCVKSGNGSIWNVPNSELMTSRTQFHTQYSDYLFDCEVNPMLIKGDSGCPIVDKENNVVGMLVAGDDKSICAFQSAAFIKNIINNYIEQHII